MDLSKPFQKVIGLFKNVVTSDLSTSKYNARDTKLEANNNPQFLELKENIRVNGLIQPIVVRPNSDAKGYEVIAGTRRVRALRQLGATQIPAIVRNDLNDIDVRIFSLAENIRRKNLEEDEIEDSLTGIYKDSVKSWEPVIPTDAEKLIIEKHGYVGLAKSYLSSLYNEKNRKSSEKIKHSIEDSSLQSFLNKDEHRIHPTDEFKTIADRIGYAYSSQYNILRGAGSFDVETDYLAELPEDVQQIIDAEVQKAIEEDKALKEQEKLDKEKELKQKAAFRYQTRTKTKKKESPKAQKGRKKASETKKKKKGTRTEQALDVVKKTLKKDKEERKSKEDDDIEKGWTTKEDISDSKKKSPQEPKTSTSAVRSRQEIIVLCTKLFRLLTTQELNVNDVAESERIVQSKAAKDQMEALAAFYADSADRALQQSVIIPTNKLLTEYRDILYEAVREAKRQDDIMHE